jgi:hypothetical protein
LTARPISVVDPYASSIAAIDIITSRMSSAWPR